MSATRNCPQCGSDLPPDAPAGVCPKCLIGLGMDQSAAATGYAETAASQPDFTAPKPHELADYFPQLEILDLLGQGGMGAVYKARQRGLDRLVALKILSPKYSRDPAFAERFTREARALARLSHPNIVAVYDSGQAGTHYFFVMEYVDGVNLREAIRAKSLSPQEALGVVPQICDALQYAHDEGVVHRDVKPENVLLDKKGRVKVADFGLAKLLGKVDEGHTLTATHQVMGTPRYMAPEQMEGSHAVDHRADIYSLGVVFYELLTGELPMGRFAAPSKKVQIDVRLDEVVLRTLEREPENRYQKASDIKTDMESIHDAGRQVRRAFSSRHAHAYEYRSQASLFGLPLVHITSGIDVQTGRARVAKGIIAIGGKAVGGIAIGGSAQGIVAIGGVAIGVIAIGGCAIGLLSIGGFALGILLALGGGAVGLGYSVGGGAIGMFASGGIAIGWSAVGGLALGHTVHGATTFGVETGHASFDHPIEYLFLSNWPASMPLWPFALPIVASAFFVLLLIGWLRRQLGDASRRRAPPPVFVERRPRKTSWIAALIVGIALVPFVTLCCLFCIGTSLYFVAEQRVEQRPDAPFIMRNESSATRNSQLCWVMAEDGPEIREDFAHHRLKLLHGQIHQFNTALKECYREYLELEKPHLVQQTDEAGHLVTTISALSESQRAKLEDKLWSRLDSMLDVEAQKTARNNLDVFPSDRNMPNQLSSDRVRPGIFGWGDGEARIEIWRVGTWFHWKIKANGYAYESKGPELPLEYRRLWDRQKGVRNLFLEKKGS